MEIIIRNLQKRIPISPKRIKRAVLKVLSSENVKKSGEITVGFVSDKIIKALNLKYLDKNRPTDVIAFDISGKRKKEIVADIIISTDTAIRNSRVFNSKPVNEIYLYLIHGILHIIGYDDKIKKDRLIMRAKEKTLLKSLTHCL